MPACTAGPQDDDGEACPGEFAWFPYGEMCWQHCSSENPVLPVDRKCIVGHRLEMIQAKEEEIRSGDKGDLGL